MTSLSEERQRKLENLLASLGIDASGVDLALLDRSLTHRSWAKEHPPHPDNERLELLGDAVIGLLTTEHLYNTMPNADEGALSKLKATAVSRRVLGHVARGLDLGPLLRLGVGEAAMGGAEKQSTIGSALEAVVGALYLSMDYGRLADRVVEHIVIPAIDLSNQERLADYKSALQEWAQRQGTEVPAYRVVEEHGPEHNREFVVEVSLSGKLLATGTGKRKQWAEKSAAAEALKQLGLDKP